MSKPLKVLAEKYIQMNESEMEQGDPQSKVLSPGQALYHTQQLSLAGNPTGLEIITHHGNIVLPIVEVWNQDGVIRLSVEMPEGLNEVQPNDLRPNDDDAPVGPL
jgi:hypothetical protein